MKKLTLLTIVAFAVVSMSSCKKDRTCTCTETNSGTTISYTMVVTKVTKKGAAQGICASSTTTTTNSNGTANVTTTSCTVK